MNPSQTNWEYPASRETLLFDLKLWITHAIACKLSLMSVWMLFTINAVNLLLHRATKSYAGLLWELISIYYHNPALCKWDQRRLDG